MKTARVWRKPLALMCALILCLAPCLASAAEPVKPGEMLSTRLLQALGAGRRLDATLGYGLESIAMDEDMSPEDFEAIQQVLDLVELQLGLGLAGDNVEIDLAFALGEQKLISGKAYLAGEGIALETNLLPGKVIFVSFEQFVALMEESGASFDIDEEALGVVMQSLGTYGAIAMEWAAGITENNMEITMEPQPATDTRDASVMQVKARAGDADFNALLAAFATQFVSDAELHKALASLTGASVEEIAMIGYEVLRQTDEARDQGHTLTVDVYAGESGETVGFDYAQTLPMDDGAMAIAVNYGRKSQEATATDTVHVGLDLGKDGGIVVDMQYNTDESVPGALTQDYTMQMRVEEATPYYGPTAMVMDAQGRTHIVVDGNIETTKEEMVYTMKQEGGPTDPDTAAMLNVPMTITSEATAEALAGDDFSYAAQMRMDMGVMVMTSRMTLASSEFVPATLEGKTVIDPFNMTEEEGAALEEELNMNLMQVLFAAMGSLPPALMQMMMEGDMF